MNNNVLDKRDIDKIRRRLDLLLKDCFRYMKKHNPAVFHNGERCPANTFGTPCNLFPSCQAYTVEKDKLNSLLFGFGIYDIGERPQTIPMELRQLRGRVRIVPALKIFNKPLPEKGT